MNHGNLPRDAQWNPEVLRSAEVFRRMDDAALRRIAVQAAAESYDRGKVIAGPQELARSLFAVTEGRARLERVSEGGKQVTVDVLTEGSLCGLEYLDSYAEPEETLIASLTPTVVYRVRVALFADVCRAQPAAAWEAAQVLARRLADTRARTSDRRFYSLDLRVARELRRQARVSPRNEITLTDDEIGALVDGSWERVNKALHRFLEADLVEKPPYGRVLVVPDAEGLVEEVMKWRGSVT